MGSLVDVRRKFFGDLEFHTVGCGNVMNVVEKELLHSVQGLEGSTSSVRL